MKMRKRMASALPVLVLLFSTAKMPVGAATIYRWTDEHGKTHYAERVPEKYQKTAKPVTTGNSSPTQVQQREAQEQATRLKSRASATESAASQPRSTPMPVPASAAAPAKRPAQVPNDRTDCETWSRLYRESLDCFGPYRTTRGATREEAFTYCTPVEQPPSRCR